MPRRTDIERILVIGSGPIVIGQACEFDYSGTQACKALRSEGFHVSLVNSNPATIMTDPEFADRTYIEPLTPASVLQVIERERPDALLPTLGGQTALNLAVALAESGDLDRLGVGLIGAGLEAIRRAEDRSGFRRAMLDAGLDVPRAGIAHTVTEASAIGDELGYPVIVRPSFTLGGGGSGFANDPSELGVVAARSLEASPVTEILVEESIAGWKEFELEVMRDGADQAVVICSIENVDPMGVHTGDSITVAPAMTLTDVEYQRMRDAALECIRAIGVETGGSNIQFAVDPRTGRQVLIEMNPRVSRSSALASKATGFPIAKIAALLAVGYTLDEIPNDITGVTPAAFEPSLDYVVVKVPRFAFEKFPEADPVLTSTMKSVGEVMAIGRTFKEALGKAWRSLEVAGADLGGRRARLPRGALRSIGSLRSPMSPLGIHARLSCRRPHRRPPTACSSSRPPCSRATPSKTSRRPAGSIRGSWIRSRRWRRRCGRSRAGSWRRFRAASSSARSARDCRTDGSRASPVRTRRTSGRGGPRSERRRSTRPWTRAPGSSPRARRTTTPRTSRRTRCVRPSARGS